MGVAQHTPIVLAVPASPSLGKGRRLDPVALKPFLFLLNQSLYKVRSKAATSGTYRTRSLSQEAVGNRRTSISFAVVMALVFPPLFFIHFRVEKFLRSGSGPF